MADNEDTNVSTDAEAVVDKQEEAAPANTSDGGAEGDSSEVSQAPEAAPKTEKKEVKPVSKDLEKLIEQIEKLSVLELSELVHALEDRFGVSASAPMMMGGPSTGSGSSTGEPQEEQTSFNVILTSGGANKIAVIKAVRELVPTLGLKEAKDLVEAAPKPVLEGVNKDTSSEAKTKLEAAGGTVQLQ